MIPLEFSSNGAEICVIGRCTFESGIGSLTYSVCESLARSFPIVILPTESDLRATECVQLPSGRRIPVCKDTTPLKVSIFCDVLWNGHYDRNLDLVPRHSLKYAYVVFDSDELPQRWVTELNDLFDLVFVCSPHLVKTLRESGVERPIACVPIALELEPLLAEPLEARHSTKVQLCSIASFHPRKGTALLIEAFAERFQGQDDVELVLHSNISFGDTFDRTRRMIEKRRLDNVTATNAPLSRAEKNALIRTCDVFVSCSQGEGYSIGPREALAYGKSLVLSDVGGHKELGGLPGVFLVDAEVAAPARYLEIDNLVFGQQRRVRRSVLADTLERAVQYVRSGESSMTMNERRGHAHNFTFTHLSTSYAELINPDIGNFRTSRPKPKDVCIPEGFKRRVEQSLGRSAARLKGVRRIVAPAYDGGFFSVFNAFMSHLVWGLQEDRCHTVLPDWDVGRMIERAETDRFTSFCYGRPSDGNVWLKIFEPLFGYTEVELNDRDFLYANATYPETRHNEHREPLMTYVHAYKLYRSRDFAQWRRQYHRIFKEHIRVREELADELDAFIANSLCRAFMIGAHVRHPSHVIEQPNATIAHNQVYVDRIYQILKERGIPVQDGDWGLFLATDQDKVVQQFQSEFGDRVSFFRDVRRTRVEEDARFEHLSEAEKQKEGRQVQHLVAANPENWSARMAWEVVRDAYALARCNLLLHVVSNVSTAVSYMNPDLELELCSA